MSKHILDRRDGSDAGNRKAKEFARVERQTGEAGIDPKIKAMQKAQAEPGDGEDRRVEEFVKRDRAGE